jgi:hypothetical protein
MHMTTTAIGDTITSDPGAHEERPTHVAATNGNTSTAASRASISADAKRVPHGVCTAMPSLQQPASSRSSA